jgi:hypothetical protein
VTVTDPADDLARFFSPTSHSGDAAEPPSTLRAPRVSPRAAAYLDTIRWLPPDEPWRTFAMNADPVMTRIGHGVELHHQRGDREAARLLFAEVWEELGGEQGDPLYVCVLAHSMADVQDDVHQELLWDQRALAAADRLTDDRTGEAGVALPVAGLYPSLHLNLCDCYRKLGDLERAREHLRLARDGIGVLGDDDYGRVIRDGLERLTRQLATT